MPRAADTKDILKKVRQIEISTRRVVNELFAGEYKSTFKGRGMEFDEVREYTIGDDIRLIDWNVSARTGGLHIKRYHEERELTLMILFDASLSTHFGTKGKLKEDAAAEVCALLAFSAIKNNDRVGLMIFTDTVEKYIPPKKGKSHVLRVIREMLTFKPVKKQTNVAVALESLMRAQKRRCIAFVISDFISGEFSTQMAIANRRHDVIAITLTDPRERALPPIGYVALEDPETGEETLVNLSSFVFQRQFGASTEMLEKNMKKQFLSIGIDRIDINTDKDYIRPILSFFKEREHRLGAG